MQVNSIRNTVLYLNKKGIYSKKRISGKYLSIFQYVISIDWSDN